MSLQELLKLYAGLSTTSGTSAAPSPSDQPAQGDRSLQLGRPPDASYFSSQAEAVLASIQQLRLLYQQQQEEEDRALSLETAGESGGPLVESGGGASSAFAARADKLSATVGALATAFAAAAAAASEPAGTPSRSGAFPSASASGGTSRPGAGAGGGIGGAPWPYFPPMQQYQQQMPTEPLVSLFTSFMAQVAGSREVSLAGGMVDGPGGGGVAEGGDTKKRKNWKKKKKAQRGGDGVLWAEAEHPPPPGAAPPHHLQPGSGLVSRPGPTGPAAGGVEEGGDGSSASASLAVLPGSSKRRGRKAKGQAKDHQGDGAGHQASLEAMHEGDEANVAMCPPVADPDSGASGTANGSAGDGADDGAGERGDRGGDSGSSASDGEGSSTSSDGDGSDGEGDDEGAAAASASAVPSASELALMFGRFLRGPGGLAGLPPAELQALMMAAQQGGDGAGPGAAGGLPAEAVRMQAELEARHAELLATTPEAAALWEDAKLMAGVAAHGGLQYRSRPGSAPVVGKDGLGGGVFLGGEAGGIDSPLRPPGSMLGGGAEGTEWQSPLVGRSMHSAVEPDDEHSGEGVSVRGRKGPVCGRMDWGRTLNICTLVRMCVSLQCWKINAVALPLQCL